MNPSNSEASANGKRFKVVAAIGLAMAVCLLPSCAGPSFSMAYRRSVTEFKAADPKPEVSGPWEGYWKSDVNGHTGKLRAIGDSPAAAADGGSCGFRYHATWAKVLSGGYRSESTVLPRREGGYSVHAEKDIAMLGVFVSDGVIEGDRFESTYRASGDQGVFILQRPQ